LRSVVVLLLLIGIVIQIRTARGDANLERNMGIPHPLSIGFKA